MPRRAHGLIPMLAIDPRRSTPLHRQITDGLRDAILQGQLPGGSKLPSTRSLAVDLNVSRSTVITAVEQLKSEGYLRARVGSGTFVPRGLDLSAAATDHPAAPSPALPVWPAPVAPPRAFFPGVPATDELARSAFGRIIRRIWSEGGPLLRTEGPVAGDPRFRLGVAQHLRAARGVHCRPEDVIITSGAQEGLALALETVVGAGDDVWIENPGYLGARRAITGIRARPAAVPVDEEGLRVAEGIWRAPEARAAYVTPSHQFPTGVPLSLRRRLELLRWAADNGRWIIEDDYDSEFRLEGRPLPALQGLDESGRVIYVGTFSKALAPALRLGFIVIPPSLRDRALEVKAARTGPASLWVQQATSRFLDEGHFARHIRRTRSLYRTRRDMLGEAVARNLRGLATLREPTGAMHAILALPPESDEEEVAERCQSAGVESFPLSRLLLPGDHLEPALVLGFAGYGKDEIRGGIRTLARVLDERRSL